MAANARWPEVVVAAALLVASACAPVSSTPAAPAAPEAIAEIDQPQKGGALVYGTIQPTSILHPLRARGNDILRNVGPGYENLLSFDYHPGQDHRIDFRVVGGLAESWEQPEGVTYLLRLRRGVKWHDGQEFTAADVLRTFQWILEEKFPIASSLRQISAMEAPDPHTVKLVLSKPSAGFLEELANSELLIAAKHAIDTGLDLNKTVIGTGPFKLRSFEGGKEGLWGQKPGLLAAWSSLPRSDSPVLRGR